VAQDAILFRPRDTDTASGITRKTLKRLAQVLDLKESEVIHKALAKYARDNLPQYEADDGPLTGAQHKAIRQQVVRKHGKAQLAESLFVAPETQPSAGSKAVRAPARTR
jgi:hypothetical protein